MPSLPAIASFAEAQSDAPDVRVRLHKSQAIQFVVALTPYYVSMFSEIKESGARVVFEDRYSAIRERVSSYVTLYDDERKIGVAGFSGILGEDGFREFNEESKNWTHDEKLEFLQSCTNLESMREMVDGWAHPESEEEWQAAELAVANQNDDERIRLARRGALLYGALFAHILNGFSLMVHGAKLTSLVPAAVSGDDEAFLKAAQIDRVLLTHHPYFIKRKQAAQDSDDPEQIAFLRRLLAHEGKPQLRGRIRFPGLYYLLSLFESVGWLHDLTDVEILDACDAAGLDRWQNRIEDVNYVTKRRLEYLQWQKSGRVSMH